MSTRKQAVTPSDISSAHSHNRVNAFTPSWHCSRYIGPGL